jgi:hypothetical protein
MNNQLKSILVINIIVITFWISIVIYRQTQNIDVGWMRDDIFPSCNGWCVGHFIHYTLLGFFAPSYWWVFMLIGHLFEYVEMILGNYSKYIDSKVVDDTLTNSAGVLVGLLILALYRAN